ncbi:hypothetical protein HY095_05565 [Candidatus Micrarchaeota archaeon]|nr:hypothetical protein [Candidatus Micrarchaeota archaeon]
MLYELVKGNLGQLGTLQACRAAGVSRSGYWDWLHVKPDPPDPLLPQIRQIATQPCYGYRRIAAVLQRRGIAKKSFVITTNSNHGLPVYPNLAKNMALTGINQLWVADITYVQLPNGFTWQW